MRKGEPLNFCCPKCHDDEFQKAETIMLEGGRVVDWNKKKEHNWASARILVNCQLCGHKYYVHRKQKS